MSMWVSRSSALVNRPPLMPMRRWMRQTASGMPASSNASCQDRTCWYTLSTRVPSRSNRKAAVVAPGMGSTPDSFPLFLGERGIGFQAGAGFALKVGDIAGGGAMDRLPGAVKPVEGQGLDCLDNAAHAVGMQRDEIRVAAHEADEAAV